MNAAKAESKTDSISNRKFLIKKGCLFQQIMNNSSSPSSSILYYIVNYWGKLLENVCKILA